MKDKISSYMLRRSGAQFLYLLIAAQVLACSNASPQAQESSTQTVANPGDANVENYLLIGNQLSANGQFFIDIWACPPGTPPGVIPGSDAGWRCVSRGENGFAFRDLLASYNQDLTDTTDKIQNETNAIMVGRRANDTQLTQLNSTADAAHQTAADADQAALANNDAWTSDTREVTSLKGQITGIDAQLVAIGTALASNPPNADDPKNLQAAYQADRDSDVTKIAALNATLATLQSQAVVLDANDKKAAAAAGLADQNVAARIAALNAMPNSSPNLSVLTSHKQDVQLLIDAAGKVKAELLQTGITYRTDAMKGAEAAFVSDLFKALKLK